MLEIIKKIESGALPCKNELAQLIGYYEKTGDETLYEAARFRAEALRDRVYGRRIFLRGLIEVSAFCKNDCYYCGLRRSNRCADRYRLTDEQILECCDYGASIGFHTFVLQGGEDAKFSDERVANLVRAIKSAHGDCAVTLSLGEKSRESYEKLYEAGADRYLLRHETASDAHYRMLHPEELTLENRKRCLYDLKSIGFQTGAGFMVGSPGQTAETLAEDLLFLADLQPHMVGIGPFIPHKDTPFAEKSAGTLEMTLFMLALTRLLLPNVLLPATTALGTIAEDGRERGFLAGANVVMPNLSPKEVRQKYMLYNNKLCSGDETAEHVKDLTARLAQIGLTVDMGRGDAINKG